MNKAVKMSMIGVGIVAALFVAALVVFVSTFDINDYRDRISKAVLDETGRTLTFKDDLKLELFPALGVSLGGVSLSNAEGFGDEAMVSIDYAMVSVKILPLLKGDIKFGQLELDGLRLNLSRKKDGLSNWDDLVGRDATAEPDDSDGEKKAFSLEVGGVNITNANLFWDDDKTDTHFIINNMNLQTGQIYKGAPFPVTASLGFSCANPEIKGSLTLSGKSSVDFDSREYGHMDMKASLSAQGKDVPGGSVNADLGVQFAALDFNKEHAQFNGVVLSAYGATVRADGSLDGITDGLRKVVATVTADPLNARETLASLGVGAPDTADSTALTKLSGMVEMTYAPGALDLKQLQLDLDGTRIVGSGQYKDVPGEPFYFARLDVGELDLDRYLPPDHEEKKQETRDAVASGDKEERVFRSEWFRDLHVDVEAKATRLRIESMWFEKVNAVIKARHGVVRISPLAAGMYGGSLSAGLTLDASGQYPKTDLIAGLSKVDVGALSRDVLGDDSYAGILDFNGAVSFQGERIQPILRSMNGKVSLRLADGVFPGVNLVNMAKETHASKEKGGEVVGQKSDSTKFGSIQGTGIIQAGVLKNKDLAVKAPGLRGDGHGAIVLPTRQIDYLLKVKLVATSKGQGGESSDDLYGVMVPIHVGGTLDNPRYWVAITEYVKALGGAVIGTAGSIVGGAVDVLKGVGKVVTGDCCEEDEKAKEEPKKKKFLGIF